MMLHFFVVLARRMPNWICGPLLCTRWVWYFNTVHELSSIEKKQSQQGRDSNPGRLGEKCERYIGAMPPPALNTYRLLPYYLLC